MLVGLIADVHGNLRGLEAALLAVSQRGCSEVVCAGDLVGYYPNVNEVIELVRETGVKCVMGNHDAAAVGKLAMTAEQWKSCNLDSAREVLNDSNRIWLAALPTTLDISLAGKDVKVTHGSPWNPLSEYVYPDNPDLSRFAQVEADYIILGHTHRPMVRRLEENTVINPGSCGQPRDGCTGAAYAVMNVASGSVCLESATYDTDSWRRELRERGVDAPLVEVFEEPGCHGDR